MNRTRYRYIGGPLNRRSFVTTEPQPTHRYGDGTPIPDGQGYAVIRACKQLGLPADVYCLSETRRAFVHLDQLYAEYDAERPSASETESAA